MGNIQIGSRIAEHRREKGITQEELANHLGVSKPAVSKWESGQSYPDILLLPELAAFFDISIDELIGYEPQMDKEEVRKLYYRLAEAFTKEPFDKVLTECEDYLKKYFSCWQLQFQMGLLLLNHVSLSGSTEKSAQILSKALEIFKRVEKSSEDVNLAKQSVHLQALCYLSLQQPVQAIELMENQHEPFLQAESLLVKAYQMKGDMDKALEYLQGYVYVNLMSILGAAPDFYRMYAGNVEKTNLFHRIYNELCELFDVEKLHPAMQMQIELAATFTFASQGNKEMALNSLEHSVELMGRIYKGKITLKGNDIFDVLEQYFADIDIEAAAPRNSEAIWHDLKNLVINNPALALMKDEARYQNIVRRLESE
jgi:transcriptional regulator with XRE-family HTH domain